MNGFAQTYLQEEIEILQQLDSAMIERMVQLLSETREKGGRLFFLGVGGGAANCSHAVNDFRKITGIEAYSPADNVAELTARTNDEGWASVFAGWLKTSHLSPSDVLFVFSVGGGDSARNVSPNLVAALDYGRHIGAKIIGVVGRDGGYTAQMADLCLIVPTVNQRTVTPHTEALQMVVSHLLVSHPTLQLAPTKWESLSEK